MSNYNVGDMIRLTRQAVGMSQEELCDGICSVQTLSRIENGKVRVKKNVYQQLMERMGRDGTKNYSVLTVDDFDVLDIMVEVNNAIFRHEYEEAEKKLTILKKGLDLDNEINFQYVKKMEYIIDAALGRITKEEELSKLENLLMLTVPNYNELLKKTYPFMHEEVMLLMNIGNVYGALGKSEKAISIYYMLIRSLNTGYMKYEDSIQITVMLINNVARYYGGIGQKDRAIRMCWNAIMKAKKNHLYTVLPKCYAEIAWNMMKQIETGERDEKDKVLCRQYLRQGYAAAVLSRQNVLGDTIKRVYRNFFDENIYCCSQSLNGEFSGSSPNN